jgi:hypothetical protein
MFLAGFLIWNLDNIFCHYLLTARNHMMLPWAVVLEGHGWWHILTGIGESLSRPYLNHAYTYMYTWDSTDITARAFR